MTSILWLRRDLRLHDLPALTAAHDDAGAGGVLPLFVADPALLATAGPARTASLLAALRALDAAYDGALVIRRGTPHDVVPALAREVGATSVHISTETTPYGVRRDARVEMVLAGDGAGVGVPLVRTGSPYAVTPGRLRTGAGGPYQVFTPFSRAWREHGWRAPAEVPTGLRWARGVDGDGLDAVGSADLPAPTPIADDDVRERFSAFLDERVARYSDDRNRPDLDATSRLSAALKYGTVHPRTLLALVAAHLDARSRGATTFVNELCWREFYADVLHHNPGSAWADLKPGLASLAYDDPTSDDAVAARFAAWTQGRTGFPLVDAGMRQLLADGWMHNRLRMVTASFLVKDLHLWWGHGARHFMDHLVDGDLASNNHGWQWVAGTGTDAAPYFRVFNPVLQGIKFDPEGDYVRRWVPELRHLPGAAAHQPWKAADGYAHAYPEPVVDHAAERDEALRRYEQARGPS